MGNKKKGQYSVEFIVVLAFAFLLIAGSVYYLFDFLNNTKESIALSQSNKVGEAILENAKNSYASNGYSKKTIHVIVPEELKEIRSENNNLVLRIVSNGKENDVILQKKFPLATKIVSDEIQGGVFTLEKINDIVVVCAGLSCTCDSIESGAECSDGMDNDCNGYLDAEDIPCGGMPTIPPPIAGYFYGYAYSENLGYISFNSSRYWVYLDGNNLKGYAYGENFGYISFNGANHGVTLNGLNIEGYAYSENVGYILFNDPPNHQVVNNSNNIEGYAYSENAGFISFDGANHAVKYQS